MHFKFFKSVMNDYLIFSFSTLNHQGNWICTNPLGSTSFLVFKVNFRVFLSPAYCVTVPCIYSWLKLSFVAAIKIPWDWESILRSVDLYVSRITESVKVVEGGFEMAAMISNWKYMLIEEPTTSLIFYALRLVQDSTIPSNGSSIWHVNWLFSAESYRTLTCEGSVSKK